MKRLFILLLLLSACGSNVEIQAQSLSPDTDNLTSLGVVGSITPIVEPCSSCLPRCEGELDAHVQHYRAVQSLIVTEKVRSGLQ